MNEEKRKKKRKKKILSHKDFCLGRRCFLWHGLVGILLLLVLLFYSVTVAVFIIRCIRTKQKESEKRKMEMCRRKYPENMCEYDIRIMHHDSFLRKIAHIGFHHHIICM